MTFTRTVAPSPLLSLADVKAHLRIDPQITDDDVLLQSYMDAVDVFLDGRSGYLGRCVQEQTWATTVPELSAIELPFPDATDAVVKYFDTDDVEQTLDPNLYFVSNGSGSGYLHFLDGVSAISVADRDDAVSVAAQFGPMANLKAVKIAAMMIVANWFQGREGTQKLPPAAAALLDPLRWISL